MGPCEPSKVAGELRLAETAVPCIVLGGEVKDKCVKCNTTKPTRLGFSCRCLCLCESCANVSGVRVQECPVCGDFTEFIVASAELFVGCEASLEMSCLETHTIEGQIVSEA